MKIKTPLSLADLLDILKGKLAESPYAEIASLTPTTMPFGVEFVMGTSTIGFTCIDEDDFYCELLLSNQSVLFFHKKYLSDALSWIELSVKQLGGEVEK